MAENKIFEKLSWEDSYPGTEVSAAITGNGDGLKPKLWNRDTVADGKYMQQDTMAKFFYRDMALASAVDDLYNRPVLTDFSISGDGITTPLGINLEGTINLISETNDSIDITATSTNILNQNTIVTSYNADIVDGFLCVPSSCGIMTINANVSLNFEADQNLYLNNVINLTTKNDEKIQSVSSFVPNELGQNSVHFDVTIDNSKFDSTSAVNNSTKFPEGTLCSVYKLIYECDENLVNKASINSRLSVVNQSFNFGRTEGIIPEPATYQVKIDGGDDAPGYLDSKISNGIGITKTKDENNKLKIAIDTAGAEDTQFLCMDKSDGTEKIKWRHPIEYIVADLNERVFSSDNSIVFSVVEKEDETTGEKVNYMDMRAHSEFVQPVTTYNIIQTNHSRDTDNYFNQNFYGSIFPIIFGRGKLRSVSIVPATKLYNNSNGIHLYMGIYGSDKNDLRTAERWFSVYDVPMNIENGSYVLDLTSENVKSKMYCEEMINGLPKIIQKHKNKETGKIEKTYFYNWIVFGLAVNNGGLDFIAYKPSQVYDKSDYAVGADYNNCNFKVVTVFENKLSDFINRTKFQFNGYTQIGIPYIQFNVLEEQDMDY